MFTLGLEKPAQGTTSYEKSMEMPAYAHFGLLRFCVAMQGFITIFGFDMQNVRPFNMRKVKPVELYPDGIMTPRHSYIGMSVWGFLERASHARCVQSITNMGRHGLSGGKKWGKPVQNKIRSKTSQ